VKGYYTVKLVGGDLLTAERIELETRYVQALEQVLGGAERVRDLCLAAAAAAKAGSQPELGRDLQAACEQAESSAWSARPKVDGARFSLSAWSANDL
jgi:hypothetical protein